MTSVRQQINLYISGVKNTLLPNDILKRAAELLGQMAVQANRDMILEKRLKTGQEMPEPSAAYKARKARIVRGKLPKGYGVRRTIYAAKSADDRGRLSGRLVSDITFQNAKFIRGENDLDFFVDLVVKGERSQKIYGYLKDKGFDGMVGLPNPNTNAGRSFRKEAQAAVFRLLAINARAKGVVLEESR